MNNQPSNQSSKQSSKQSSVQNVQSVDQRSFEMLDQRSFQRLDQRSFQMLEFECGCIFKDTDKEKMSSLRFQGGRILGCKEHKKKAIKRFLQCSCGRIEEISLHSSAMRKTCLICKAKATILNSKKITPTVKRACTDSIQYHFTCSCVKSFAEVHHNKIIKCPNHPNAKVAYVSAFCALCGNRYIKSLKQNRMIYCSSCDEVRKLNQKLTKLAKKGIKVKKTDETQCVREPECIHYDHCLFDLNIFEKTNNACLKCKKYKPR